MLKPLSVWAYYLNNKSKIIPVVIIITLSVFALITGSTLLNFVNKETNKFIEYYKQYYSLQVGNLSESTGSKTDLYNQIQGYSQSKK
jgi:ABC-type lipoprotein release transport system permease subunit